MVWFCSVDGCTVSTVLTVVPEYVAEIVTVVAAVTVKVVTVKFALLAPVDTVVLAGTDATAGLLLAKVTRIPPPGAAADSCAAPDDAAPPLTVLGETVTPVRVGVVPVGIHWPRGLMMACASEAERARSKYGCCRSGDCDQILRPGSAVVLSQTTVE